MKLKRIIVEEIEDMVNQLLSGVVESDAPPIKTTDQGVDLPTHYEDFLRNLVNMEENQFAVEYASRIGSNDTYTSDDGYDDNYEPEDAIYYLRNGSSEKGNKGGGQDAYNKRKFEMALEILGKSIKGDLGSLEDMESGWKFGYPDLKKDINSPERMNEMAGRDIANSLFGLVKYNGGYFKSDKQRDFIHSQAQEPNTYVGGGGEMYGNSYNFFFDLDDKGVTKVQKHTRKGVKDWWERSDASDAESTKNRLGQAFSKAVKKAREINQGQFDEIKQRVIADLTPYSKNSERDFETARTTFVKGLRKGTVETDIQELETLIPTMTDNVNVTNLLTSAVIAAKGWKELYDKGIINPAGYVPENSPPLLYNKDSDSNRGDYVPPTVKPEFSGTNGRQNFIDFMAKTYPDA